jgi:hypothetical protein
VDSVSRAHYHRTMRATASVFETRAAAGEVEVLEFAGLGTVGLSTAHNAGAMLGGAGAQNQRTPVMTFAQQLGYATWESCEWIGGMIKHGNMQGTGGDMGPSPLSEADLFTNFVNLNCASPICVGTESLAKHLADHTLRFHEAHGSGPGAVPQFSWTSFKEAHTNRVWAPKRCDADVASLVRSLTEHGAGRNGCRVTLLVTDHGSLQERHMRERAGMLERGLPLLLMAVPRGCGDRVPMAALRANQRRLVQQTDVYLTLRHLLSGPREAPPARPDRLRAPGQSLLVEVPRNRTARDAGLREDLSFCTPWRNVDLAAEAELAEMAARWAETISAVARRATRMQSSCHQDGLENAEALRLYLAEPDLSGKSLTGRGPPLDFPRPVALHHFPAYFGRGSQAPNVSDRVQ